MFSSVEKDHISSETTPRWLPFLLIALGVATLFFGSWSFFGYKSFCDESIATRLYHLGALFEFSEANVGLPHCYDHWQTEVARFTGPAATITGVVWLLTEFLRDPIDRLRLRWFSDHTVIIGFGEKGKVRAAEAASSGGQVVAIENAPGENSHAVAARHGVVLLIDDGCHDGALSRVRLPHAARFVVATGDDSRNLSIAQAIAQRVRKERPANREIEIEASVSDPLLHRALDVDGAGGLVDAFCMEDIAAYQLCEAARFPAVADLLGQRQIHIAMLGFDRFGVSAAAQILRSSQTADLGVTRFTILSKDAVAARNLLLLSFPGIEDITEIAYLAVEPRVAAINGPLMGEIEAVAPITAIVVLGERSADTLPVALAVREASRRTGHWKAPIFFGAEHAASLTGFPRSIAEEKRFSKVLHPFEISSHLCMRKQADERDRVAREFHECYLRTFEQMQAKGQKPSSASQALVPWRQLARTYRLANRRAADHITAKLLSAGCVSPPGSPSATQGFDLLAEEGALERLAELEHLAWSIDRQLDGWRPGKIRDDLRWIHDCLVPYAELREETKELDRAQIRELNVGRLPRIASDATIGKTLVRFDLWVGLIGSPSLTRAEADWAKHALSHTVLPRLLAAHPEHNFTLLSALAPGADLISTKTILEGLAAQQIQHRLLVTEAVPVKEFVEQFETPWRNGAVGDLDLSARGLSWPQARSALTACVAEIEGGVACERILELDSAPLGADQLVREAGTWRQNAYIIQRAHVVIAIIKPAPSDEPGETGEAIAWRRNRLAMPETMPTYAPRPNRAAPGFPGLFVLNVEKRTISEEPVGGDD